ncbi:hypothetical protein QQS21_011893 [Conoideocrella luteorostrata]|uniref:Uncharacterized protein n=1 Tax=Conoideocrella luteorostrata TaxID=1105319 RepID=A0AAJ0CC81_9HYPO|nr:hypothetical protein QQS21_011893 [Conoideocrella luteorostrata]
MNASTPICTPTADEAFGPAIEGCRSGFDFTLVFEQSIFVILPASLLLLGAPFRLVYLGKSPVIINGSVLRNAKLLTAGVLAALQLALVILWASRPTPISRVNSISLAASCVSCASTMMSCALSYAEHGKSLRPSSLLNVFLLVSLLLDAAVLRTLWMSAFIGRAVRAVFTASFAAKGALLVLEAVEKSRLLLPISGSRRDTAPEETAGLYRRAVYAWVTPLLRTGFRKLLQPEDLFELDEQMKAAYLGDRFWANWNNASPVTVWQKHRLLACCAITLRRPLAAVVAPRAIELVFTICQPLVLNRFLQFLSDAPESSNVGYGLVASYGLVYFGIAVSQALYWHANARFVTMLRGILVPAIFSKATEISITATDNAAAVTLMSTDVEVIVRAMKQINELWANVIQIAIGTWLLSNHIGYAAAGPIVVSTAALVATLLVSPLAKKYRIGWLKITQKRVGITSAMMGHIKSIKMSGLTQKLSSTILALRIEEIKASRPFRIFGAITSAIAQIPLLISPPVAFAMYQGVIASGGPPLNTTRLFSSLSFIILLAQPLFWMFEMILDLSAAFGAFDRIQKFLTEASRVDYRELAAPVTGSKRHPHHSHGSIELQSLRSSAAFRDEAAANSDTSVEVKGCSFAWTADKTVIKHIDLRLSRGQLAMIVGPVASGKSTLLKGLLGEVTHASGRIRLQTNRTSWCDQNPWILNQSIRQNIIGYSQFNEALYIQVTEACDLQSDFLQLPLGDMTVVGSKGFALSGGQKQRVKALARAVYSQPEIAFFDDLFSGLDNHTSKRIFKNLFGSGGLLRQWRSTIILATQSVMFLPLADFIMSLGRDGHISQEGSFSELQIAEGYIKALMENRTEGNGFNSHQDAEEKKEESVSTSAHAKSSTTAARRQDDKRRQLGDSSIYRYYFSNMGMFFVIGLLGLEVGWAFLQSFPTVWLNFLANATSTGDYSKTGYYLGIYAALQIIGVIWFAALIWFVMVLVAAKSGISLHQRLLSTVIRAPLVLFTMTDLGSIITRFSQDIGMVDNNLPLALVVSLASFLGVIAKAGLLAASSYYVAITFPFLGTLYFYLQRGYLRTSRQLRLLDLEQKAPVYSQFLETLGGLSTLRAFRWSQPAIIHNHDLVDRSQKPFYLLIMVQRWLVLILDLTTAALALLVVGFAVQLRGSVSVGLTGVSLVQLISLSETLNLLMQFWTSMETSLGAVARIKQFAEETGEEHRLGENSEPLADWPSRGHVVIRNLSASYGDDHDVQALDSISLEIQPGEKVAVCGRTGSGKSSLFLTLLKLLDPSSGTISIDSTPLSSVPRESLRSKIITVSQDQFVLPGTIRENIDPFQEYASEEILQSLREVGLGDIINDQTDGLNTKFDEDTLSHGQKQLFFVARAVLRKGIGKLVLLDEATSSIDQDTEQMIRAVIDTEFKSHTVITIAHRLDTVIHYDKVVVLDAGRVVEVGCPRELRDTDSRFAALWNASNHRSD